MSKQIAVCDSGIGGLTYLKKLVKENKYDNYYFYADNLNMPYGVKTKEEIVNLSKNILKYFENKDVSKLVLACNTISSNALTELNEMGSKLNILPVSIIDITMKEFSNSIGIEKSNNKKFKNEESNIKYKNLNIFVLGTTATIKSKKYQKELLKLNIPEKYIHPIPCDTLAKTIEENLLNIHDGKDKEKIIDEVKGYIKKNEENKQIVQLNNTNMVIMACTHYSLIKNEIQEAFKQLGYVNIQIVDPSHFNNIDNKKQNIEKNNVESTINVIYTKKDDTFLNSIKYIFKDVCENDKVNINFILEEVENSIN